VPGSVPVSTLASQISGCRHTHPLVYARPWVRGQEGTHNPRSKLGTERGTSRASAGITEGVMSFSVVELLIVELAD